MTKDEIIKLVETLKETPGLAEVMHPIIGKLVSLEADLNTAMLCITVLEEIIAVMCGALNCSLPMVIQRAKDNIDARIAQIKKDNPIQ